MSKAILIQPFDTLRVNGTHANRLVHCTFPRYTS